MHRTIQTIFRVICCTLFLVMCTQPLMAAVTQTRIAIVDLDSQGEKAESEELGKMASHLLTTAFVQEGRFDVIERQALQKVVEEQQLGISGLVDADTAAQLGRVLGATYIVTGAVISYPRGMDLVVKIVETDSASIKVADRLSAGSSSSLFRKIPGFVSQVMDQFPVRGMIVYQKKKIYTLDVGKKAGVKRDMKFEVYQEGQPIKHPVSGEILGVERIPTGLLRITEVQEKMSMARVVKQEQGQKVAVGHRVTSVKTPAVRAGSSYTPASTDNLRFDRAWGRQGTGMADFYLPYGIDTDAEGNVYVADTYNNRVQVFDSNGTFMRSWGQKGSGMGDLLVPYDIAVDRQGNIYVADTYNFRIVKFNASGRFLLQWGQKGKGIGQFAFLSGIAVGPEGSIYTTDAKMHRVQVFDSGGRFLRSWGQPGKTAGSFVSPMGIAVDNNGNVYVADSKMQRIQVFGSRGNFMNAIVGTMAYPTDVDVDATTGNIYVLDGASHFMWEMTSAGQILRTFGGPGSGSAKFVKPYGLCTDDAGNVYVADTANSRIQKFSRR